MSAVFKLTSKLKLPVYNTTYNAIAFETQKCRKRVKGKRCIFINENGYWHVAERRYASAGIKNDNHRNYSTICNRSNSN